MSFLVGAISGLGSIVGAGISSSAAGKAANAQVKAAQIAADTQKDMFGQAKNALSPYINTGNNASYLLNDNLMKYTQGVPAPTMTQADLEGTPGYQFTLSQGLKSTQNSAAARGLGVSGAALKGAATYATGLSDNTYNTRFNQAQTNWLDQVANNTNSFNKLSSIAGMGTSAAGALAGQAIQTGQGIGQTQIGAGNAQAAGINAAGQATAAGLTGASGAFNNALNQYMNGGSTGGLYANGNSGTGGFANMLGSNFLNGGF